MARINAAMSVSWRAMATNARLSVGFLGLRHWRDQGPRHRPGERLSGAIAGGSLCLLFRYEITRHDPARRRLCQASLHLASFSRIRTNQISGSDLWVVRRRFSEGILASSCGRSVRRDVRCTTIGLSRQSVTCHSVAATIAHCCRDRGRAIHAEA
jgi:hypothetical protein